MKKIFLVFILILLNSIAHSQIKDEGPKAYFGYLGLDSMKRTDLMRYDTLKMDNQNLKVLRFYAALSAFDCKSCASDVTLIRVEGNAISGNQGLFNRLKIKQSNKTLITVMDIEFINPQGKLIKYPREFSFKLYE